MKCPVCKKPVEARFQHCPYCGSAIKKKKGGIGALNIGLIALACVQIAAGVTGVVLVKNGTVAARYLRSGKYEKAASMLEKYGGSNNSEVIEQTLWAAKCLRADYEAGKMDYGSMQHTLVMLRDVSEQKTAGKLDAVLDALESERKNEQALQDIMLIFDAGDYVGALHRIQDMETSKAWQSYSEELRSELLQQKNECADKMIEKKIETGHYFDDGDGKGALHLAFDCLDWYPELFGKTNEKVMEELKKLDNEDEWLDLAFLCNTGFPELQGYQQIEGFSYGDYVGIQMGSITHWSSVECDRLLSLINSQREKDGLEPLVMDKDLRRVAAILAGKMLPTDTMVDEAKHADDLNIQKYDCYTYLFNTNVRADGMLREMLADNPPKRHFSDENPGENLLNADWIDSIGIALNVRQNGKLQWFLIATGSKLEK